eukprot:539997-Pleurochrysis_carterae.AAC.1
MLTCAFVQALMSLQQMMQSTMGGGGTNPAAYMQHMQQMSTFTASVAPKATPKSSRRIVPRNIFTTKLIAFKTWVSGTRPALQ